MTLNDLEPPKKGF